MKILLVLFAILRLTFQHQIDENGIVLLTEGNFKELLVEFPHAIVLFHEDDDLLPIFNADRLILTTNNYDYIPIARIYCSYNDSVYENQELEKLPTIRYYRYGKAYDEYRDELTGKAIAGFAKTRADSKSFGLLDYGEFEDFLKEDDKVRVAAKLCIGGSLKNQYFNATQQSDAIYAHYFTKGEEKITLFRPKHLHNKFESDSVDYQGGGDLQSWIKAEYHGLAGIRNLANEGDFANPIIAYYNVDYATEAKLTNYWRNRVLTVASNFTKYQFAVSAVPPYMKNIERMGIDLVKAGNKPIIVINTTVGNYFMEDEFSVQNFSDFVRLYDANQLDVYVKSQEIPKFDNEAVKRVVAKNFEKEVMLNEMDTMVMFYSPWCIHCRNLMPIFTQTAIELKHEDVLFAKMDIDANHYMPMFEIGGVPIVYWLAKNDKYNPVEYAGQNTVKGFVSFVAKNSTKVLKKFDRSGRTKRTEL